jgi:hypothetical protein
MQPSLCAGNNDPAAAAAADAVVAAVTAAAAGFQLKDSYSNSLRPEAYVLVYEALRY